MTVLHNLLVLVFVAGIFEINAFNHMVTDAAIAVTEEERRAGTTEAIVEGVVTGNEEGEEGGGRREVQTEEVEMLAAGEGNGKTNVKTSAEAWKAPVTDPAAIRDASQEAQRANEQSWLDEVAQEKAACLQQTVDALHACKASPSCMRICDSLREKGERWDHTWQMCQKQKICELCPSGLFCEQNEEPKPIKESMTPAEVAARKKSRRGFSPDEMLRRHAQRATFPADTETRQDASLAEENTIVDDKIDNNAALAKAHKQELRWQKLEQGLDAREDARRAKEPKPQNLRGLPEP